MNQIFSNKSPHWLLFLSALLLCAFLAACGGGSSSSSSGSDSTSGGSSGGGTSNSNPCTPYSGATPTAANVVNVSIDCAVFGAVNEPFVNVTLCSTGDPTNCLTIDHILVDTGSVGLRVFAEPSSTAALSTLALTPQTSGGYPVGECLQFVQGNTWGAIRLANIKIGGESANNVAIQVIGDSTFSEAPQACTGTGSNTLLSTPSAFGANGVLGIGVTLQDCGSLCVQQSTAADVYFSCPSSGCVNIGMPLNEQVQNPVSLFSTDNNGVILSLNSIPASGSATAGGTLTFGIDTSSNNVSTNANTILVDSNYGVFTTTFEGQTYDNSYIDSGSNGFYFNPPSNESIAQCTGTTAGFYCPAVALNNLVAQLSGLTGSSAAASVSFNITNANTLFDSNNAAFNSLGGTAVDVPGIGNGNTFDWGIPFFYGNNIYVAFEGSQTSKGNGPYFGF